MKPILRARNGWGRIGARPAVLSVAPCREGAQHRKMKGRAFSTSTFISQQGDNANQAFKLINELDVPSPLVKVRVSAHLS
jgi:hypothetical protein